MKCWKCGYAIANGEDDGSCYATYPPRYAHAHCREREKDIRIVELEASLSGSMREKAGMVEALFNDDARVAELEAEVARLRGRNDLLRQALADTFAEREEARERAERLDVQLQDTQSDYGALEAEVARLKEALREVYGHTACAVTQSLDCDDQIIIGHCRDAAAIALVALKAKENN